MDLKLELDVVKTSASSAVTASVALTGVDVAEAAHKLQFVALRVE